MTRLLLVVSFLVSIEASCFTTTSQALHSQQAVSMSSSTSSWRTDGDDSAGLLVSSMHLVGQDDGIRLILASQSPRRREILDMMGLAGRYEATPSPLDESALQAQLSARPQALPPVDYTRTLAEHKANALAEQLLVEAKSQIQQQQQDNHGIPCTLVLGSDTVVDLEGVGILEKPRSIEEARAMLQRLSGNWHMVHTGVAIVHVEGQTASLKTSFTEEARVKFARLSDADIAAYLATGEPMDKAGSYGIQGIGGQLVETIQGDFFTVMGLPMHSTSRELARVIRQVRKRNLQVGGVQVHWVPLERNEENSPHCFAVSSIVDLSQHVPPVNFLATQVWPSARLAAFALKRHLNPEWSVCELGCGPGLPSITAAKLGAPKVVATDLDPFALELVRAAAQEQALANVEAQLFDLVVAKDTISASSLPAADLYLLSDVFESAQVARGAALVVVRALAAGSRVWVFAQTDRSQREVFLAELRCMYGDKLCWIAPEEFDGTSLLWLCDVDESAVSYG